MPKTGLVGQSMPGVVRDAIIGFLQEVPEATASEIQRAVESRIGGLRGSSVRSYLRLNTPGTFTRKHRGLYRLADDAMLPFAPNRFDNSEQRRPAFTFGRASLFNGDCFEWLRWQPHRSIHAVVTDPPYALLEYTETEKAKLRSGRGGVWRIPPSYDGHQRSPLPRFTVLSAEDKARLRQFFFTWTRLLYPALVPGAHVFIASNPLVSHVVAHEVERAGLERRGEVIRLVMTMRGGDRPKNAHDEYPDVTVMPRSMWEPWLLFRKPVEGRVSDNLRRWGTGGLRRPSASRPFGDVIQSSPTRPAERRLAPHPSLKPQAFLRQVVRAALPLGHGVVLDPFAGAGSTLAACEAVGYQSVGIELDEEFVALARSAMPALARLPVALSGDTPSCA